MFPFRPFQRPGGYNTVGMHSGRYKRRESQGPGVLPAQRRRLLAEAKGERLKKLKKLEPNAPIRAEIESLGLSLDIGRYKTMMGRSIREKSIMDYHSDIRGFWNFLRMIGDFKSCIILLDEAPQFSPPVNPLSIEAYLSNFD